MDTVVEYRSFVYSPFFFFLVFFFFFFFWFFFLFFINKILSNNTKRNGTKPVPVLFARSTNQPTSFSPRTYAFHIAYFSKNGKSFIHVTNTDTGNSVASIQLVRIIISDKGSHVLFYILHSLSLSLSLFSLFTFAR